jgi:peptidoglycan endopeptidase LytE
MPLKRMLAFAMAACALSVCSIQTRAQNSDTRPRRVFMSAAEEVKEVKPRKTLTTKNSVSSARVYQLISAAINERLGAPYQWAGTGPDSFDCSGFVWDTFRSAGIVFQRASAATLWEQFLAPPPEQQLKFGTLVFFSGQTHVGIVADERGFYHASKHQGVVYETFNDYWLSRIDGFRRVPLPTSPQRAD